MQKLFGIIPAATGSYVLATAAGQQSSVKTFSVRTLPENEILRNIMLLHRGVVLGLPCIWMKRADELLAGETAAQADTPFIPRCRTPELDIHAEALADNMLGAVGDDSFLATVPLSVLEKPEDSFVSIYASSDACRIAIIAAKKMQLRLTMAPSTAASIRGHLRRIKQYCTANGIPWPSQIYLLGEKARYENAFPAENALHVSIGSKLDKDENALLAIGAALTQAYPCATPPFCGPAEKARVRSARAGVYIFSAAAIVCSIIVTALGWGLEALYEKRLESYEARYHQAIKNNTEIRKLLDKSNDLADKVSGLEKTFSHQTPWGRLLDYLGRDCPKGIYIEKLGSQPDEKDSTSLRVALSGWTENEESVTACISKLQKMPFLTKVSLSSMERAKKKKNISLFRIVCSLDLRK